MSGALRRSTARRGVRATPYPVKRRAPAPSPGPTFVTMEMLGLNRGASSHVGIPGKLYHIGDRVTPIVDAMQSLSYYQSMGAMQRLAAPQAAEAPAPTPTIGPDAVCRHCGTTDRNDLQPVSDGDAMSCVKCGVVCTTGLAVSLHRDKNCTEDEDKTVRADRPRETHGDRFDKKAPSAAEARREREREAQGVVFSRKAKEARGLGWAPEAVARRTAQAARDREAMSAKDKSKEFQILRKLDELFVALEPMDAAVKRYCRIQAYCTWGNAVRHAACCQHAGGHCHLNLQTRGYPVIAESVLMNALQNLAHGVDTVESVAHSHVVALNNKFSARMNTTSATAAQRAVRQQVARLMAHDNLAAALPACAECSPCGSKASSSISASPAASSPSAAARRGDGAGGAAEDLVQRLEQGVSCPLPNASYDSEEDGANGSDDAAPIVAGPALQRQNSTHVLRLRDCVDRLRSVLSSTRAPVMHATMAVVANNECMNALCVAYDEDARLQALNLQAFAFVILETVARRAERASGAASESASRMRPRLLQSIGTTAEQVEGAVRAADAALPADAVRAPSGEGDDDELF